MTQRFLDVLEYYNQLTNYKHCFQMLSILKKKAINLRALHKHSAITIVTTPIALVDILDASLVYAAHEYDTDYYRNTAP